MDQEAQASEIYNKKTIAQRPIVRAADHITLRGNWSGQAAVAIGRCAFWGSSQPFESRMTRISAKNANGCRWKLSSYVERPVQIGRWRFFAVAQNDMFSHYVILRRNDEGSG